MHNENAHYWTFFQQIEETVIRQSVRGGQQPAMESDAESDMIFKVAVRILTVQNCKIMIMAEWHPSAYSGCNAMLISLSHLIECCGNPKTVLKNQLCVRCGQHLMSVRARA